MFSHSTHFDWMAAIGWWIYLSVTYFPRQAQSFQSLLSASGWFEKPPETCSLYFQGFPGGACPQTLLDYSMLHLKVARPFFLLSTVLRWMENIAGVNLNTLFWVSTACALSKCMTTPVVTDPIMKFLPFAVTLSLHAVIHIHSYIWACIIKRFQPPSLCCVYGSHVPSFRLCKSCFFWSCVIIVTNWSDTQMHQIL